MGFHVGPSVGHDNHWRNWGVSTDARVGVIANSLDRQSLMSALRARRTIASEDKNLTVIFRAGNAIGGDVVAAPTPGTPLPLTVEIRDPDEPQSRYRVDVLMDWPGGDRARRPVETFRLEGNTSGRYALEGLSAGPPGFFVLLKVTQSSSAEGDEEHQELEDRVWTAPIWFEASMHAGVAPASSVRIASLVPNPTGNEFQNERVTIANRGSTTVDLAGWQVRDASGNVWLLSGPLNPGQAQVFNRSGQPMSLNNDGDEIELVNASGIVVQSFTYERVGDGVEISVPQTE